MCSRRQALATTRLQSSRDEEAYFSLGSILILKQSIIPRHARITDADWIRLFSEALRLDCAVLDLHYCTSSAGGNLFAISTSNGKVGLFVWLTSPLRLKLLSWINISGGSDALVTSFVWINGLRSNDRNSALLAFAVTLTDGSARLYAGDNLEILSAGKVQLIYSFRRHSQEAWYIAFSESRRLLFSGGDDMALSAYSLESLVPFESTGELAPLWTDHKSHYAGVTAILPLEQIQTPFNTLYFLTGSYDERIRVYKLDQATKRHVVAEQGLGGGVWRLKQISDSWHEYPSSDFEGQRDCTLVLASCMHAGAKVLQVVRTCEGHCIHDSCIWTIDVVAKFEEHDSMNYASDVRMLNGKPQIVSTSFYDKRLCFWSLGKWSLGQNALRAADLIRARMRDDVSD